MPKHLAAVGLAVVIGVCLYGAQIDTIRAVQAKDFVGKLVVVQDTVAQRSHEPQSGFTYLNFGAEFPKQVFRVVIPDAVERLIDVSVLMAARVRVRGIPQLGSSGTPEIICSEPSQLTLPPTRTTAPSTVMTPLPAPAPPPQTRPCCRVCTTGQACGNSCISRRATCRQPPGCACNG